MPASQGRVLLADDEEIFLEVTQDFLQEEGYDCHVVRNAEELGQALQGIWDFDVLITDLNMPGNRVLEMVREIRSRSSQLPVIVVTGYPSVPTAVESIHLHVLEYLIKPVDYSALLAAIEQGFQQMQVLRSVRYARKEALLRAERLAQIEETLQAGGTTISSSDIEAILLRDSSNDKTSPEEFLGALEQPAPSSHVPTAEDYFHLREALFEAIQVLQKTKSAFRSRDLAVLRKTLEKVLACTKERMDNPSPPHP